MKLRLSDLAACFEGVIPSIIATAAADGTPNVSYLSHVVQVDDEHVALSNQFFAKTAANIRANPNVTLILVDCLTGDQFALDVRFVRSVDSGPLFNKVSLQLRASSAQVGMAEIMRLRSADIFRVLQIDKVPSPVETIPLAAIRQPVSLQALADAIQAIEQQAEAEDIIDRLLHSVGTVVGYRHALVLIPDVQRECFVTTGSMGYEHSGLSSEITGLEGLIGAAAANRQTIKISDMSRVRRFGEAIAKGEAVSEDMARAVAFPELPMAMSQIAVPMLDRGDVIGILFVESPERMAFRNEDEAALEMLAREAARALKRSERVADRTEAETAPPAANATASGRAVRVTHHRIDDSIFVDDAYVVKGIAGALLRLMIERHLEEGRCEFSNRELRLALAARMPEIKDNLETRLLLLRRRLEEKQAPVRVVRTGRGRIRLDSSGPLILVAAQE